MPIPQPPSSPVPRAHLRVEDLAGGLSVIATPKGWILFRRGSITHVPDERHEWAQFEPALASMYAATRTHWDKLQQDNARFHTPHPIADSIGPVELPSELGGEDVNPGPVEQLPGETSIYA